MGSPRQNRKWIKTWRLKLMDLRNTIDYDRPDDLKEIEGLDQAMLEDCILSMPFYRDAHDIDAHVKAVLHDIAASEKDPHHWRHKEAEEIRKILRERTQLYLLTPTPRDRLH